jgi:8-oxo-dGTP pyrophosphatase MutT (NUDIX family)
MSDSNNIVVIALRHPYMPDLYLMGLRRDTMSWTLPGGHVKEGETWEAGAYRECLEESGVSVKLTYEPRADMGKIRLYLGTAPHDVDLKTPGQDPDHEFLEMSWLNPMLPGRWHIPPSRNILVRWLHQLRKLG